MELIADILLGAGAVGAGVYCLVLARRLRGFATLDKGVGGAIAAMSRQVDEMTRALDSAQTQATASAARLDLLTQRGEAAAQRLELLIAALHDLPDPATLARPAKLRLVRRRRSAADVDADGDDDAAPGNQGSARGPRLEAAE
jgi:hypothetical protein